MHPRNYVFGLSILTGVFASFIVMSLFATSPARLGPLGVTLWFVVLFGLIGDLLTLVVYFGKRLALGQTDQPTKRFLASLRQGLLLGGWLTVVLALSSLRQLNARDVLLSLTMVLLMETYFNLR